MGFVPVENRTSRIVSWDRLWNHWLLKNLAYYHNRPALLYSSYYLNSQFVCRKTESFYLLRVFV